MTFDDDARIGSGRVKRRTGRGVAIGGGGGALLVIALFVIGQVTGVDLSGLAGGGGVGGGGGGTDEELAQCETGADANARIECRMQGAASSLDAYWSAQDVGYEQPELILFDQQVDTACGGATSAVGPFYCPADRTAYIDTSFFAQLSSQFGAEAGPLAELYVVAHEWGHHIQNLLGTTDGLDTSQTGPDSNGVRLELQADCYAGAWAGAAPEIVDENGTPFLEPITPEQLQTALSTAEAIGDDRIQERTQGQVQPETWTHGASEQRERWFTVGYENGWGACDTFAAPAGQL